jgi:hypothetical protein
VFVPSSVKGPGLGASTLMAYGTSGDGGLEPDRPGSVGGARSGRRLDRSGDLIDSQRQDVLHLPALP